MATLDEVIRNRRDALLRTFVRNPAILVECDAAEMLPIRTYHEHPGGLAETERLGRRAEYNVVVLKGQGSPDETWSVWAASGYGSYRAAYLAFLRVAYGLAPDPAAFRMYDVDHLLNRARAPTETNFIRLEAVPGSVNQAWGALFEKASSGPGFYANRARGVRSMSYMICAKLAGQMPPAGPADAAGVARLTSFFRTMNLPETPAQTRRGLENMLDFAYRRR